MNDAAAGRNVQHRPLYWQVLRLKWVRPSGLLRVFLVEGLLLVALVLTLAGATSAWAFLALPASGAVVVKAHDVIEGQLRRL